MTAPRVERHRPPGLPMRTMQCSLCRRDDVAEIDIALALNRRPAGISASSAHRHRHAHLWAWLLDIPNAGRARSILASAADDLAGRQEASTSTLAALAALARIDEHLYPQHAALADQRQRELARADLAAARRLVEYGTVDGHRLVEAGQVAHLAAARVADRIGRNDRCRCGAGTRSRP